MCRLSHTFSKSVDYSTGTRSNILGLQINSNCRAKSLRLTPIACSWGMMISEKLGILLSFSLIIMPQLASWVSRQAGPLILNKLLTRSSYLIYCFGDADS